MKTLLKHWGWVAALAAVLFAFAGFAQWKAKLRAVAVAEHVTKQAADSVAKMAKALVAEREAKDLAERNYHAAVFVTDGIAVELDKTRAEYARHRAKTTAASASTDSMMLVPKAWVAAVESALIAADSMAREAGAMTDAMKTERAAADSRFAADSAVIVRLTGINQQQGVQIQQLEILLEEQRPGTLDQVAKAALLISGGYGLARMLGR